MTIIDPSFFEDAKIPTHKRCAMDAVVATVMTFSIEVISLPVSDVDRAVRFYVDRVGFRIDVDYAPNDTFRLVQLTPPGSSCSIQFGTGLGMRSPARFVAVVFSCPTSRRRGIDCWKMASRSVPFGTKPR